MAVTVKTIWKQVSFHADVSGALYITRKIGKTCCSIILA